MKRSIEVNVTEETTGKGAIAWGAEWAGLARRYGTRIAVADRTGTLTFAALFRRAGGLAGTLAAAGVTPGMPVASFLRNGCVAVWASYGITLSGAAETPLNPNLSEADQAHCLRVSGARHVVTTAEHRARFAGLGLAVHLVEAVAERAWEPGDFPAPPAEAWGKVLFTSGTTGLAKGVVYTNERRWLANLLLRASLPAAPAQGTRLLMMTPFSHGASLMTYAYLDRGAGVILHDGVDAEYVLGLIAAREVDQVFAPPTVLTKLLDSAGGRTLPGLDTVFCGTAVLSPALYARARAVFGPVVRITYGKTEVVNPITVLDGAETEAWYAEGGADADACVGWPASGVEIAVRDADGVFCPAGEAGEVLIRARHMMTGYLTLDGYAPLGPDGFHETGDLGYFDPAGRLHLSGRAADVMKSGGYKVAPEEVERILAPAVAPGEVAAVGIPSEYWGEVIVAAVERPPEGWRARAEAAAREMTGYKRPRAYFALDALPRNAMGKVRRAAIRAHVLEHYRLTDGPRPAFAPREPG